ncbi:glycosyltransferase family 2 protein, partial [Fuscibacter oryzae]
MTQTDPAPLGIVVPVRNERARLQQSVPAVLACVGGLDARIIWVCNGCTDDSAWLIRHIAGSTAEVIELVRPGKTSALQAGDDALEGRFPRIYLDADVILTADGLQKLIAPLIDGAADLTAARRVHDTEGVSYLSAAIARTWESLPYAKHAAFLGAIGLSAAGRSRWL